ncbi:abscisic acid receptor PYL12-like [Spinacia oleracea]|uniref:Abscisic acid receptor PYL12-like n=1 Tax=Spinacia oleracea TaxID=3562 RepID=A0A9R0JG46_SPIOL|nr:abscisic acid receptor PYL12-like [Spinacia oleracea]
MTVLGLPVVQTNMVLPSIQECSFSVEQAINAPIEVVWSIIREFHNPKAYKMFISSSASRSSSNTLGSLRNITHVTGFPSTTSIERLDDFSDNDHVLAFSIVGGDHSRRLANYQGTISLRDEVKKEKVNVGDRRRTIVTEKYSVDVPRDSTLEETRYLVDTLVGFNLKSLARVAEHTVS